MPVLVTRLVVFGAHGGFDHLKSAMGALEFVTTAQMANILPRMVGLDAYRFRVVRVLLVVDQDVG